MIGAVLSMGGGRGWAFVGRVRRRHQVVASGDDTGLNPNPTPLRTSPGALHPTRALPLFASSVVPKVLLVGMTPGPASACSSMS